jgi:hypothetical protein
VQQSVEALFLSSSSVHPPSEKEFCSDSGPSYPEERNAKGHHSIAVFLIMHTLCRQDGSYNRADSEGYNRMMILRPLPSGSLRVTQGASKHMTALDSCV